MSGQRQDPSLLGMLRDRPRLNLGCGRFADPGWINVDSAALPGVDLVLDLDACSPGHLPLPGDSIESFHLSHVLEHIRNTLPLMQELHRVAKEGATMTVRLPHGASDDAWEDPTHVRAYFLNSFGYFSQPYYWRADYGYRGDWRTESIALIVDKGRGQGLEDAVLFSKIQAERNWVLEMRAELVAVKPIRQPRAELQTSPRLLIERV